VRYVAAGLLSLISLSCRELDPFAGSQIIDGYQLDGRVTTGNGVPLDSVKVVLYYYYAHIGDSPADTIQVVVTDSMQVVDISVVNSRLHFFKTIFFGRRHSAGPVPNILWDGRDYQNKPAPSGLYYIRYIIDSNLIKYSPVVIDGNITTVTDIQGRFRITNDNLPVDKYFDLYKVDGIFYGVEKILPKIALELYRYGSYSEYPSIELTKNKIITRAFTLQ